MRNKLSLFLIIACCSALMGNIADARQGCCSHHGGVCECGCCDGTSLSSTCAPYYPECNSQPSVEMSGLQTKTPPANKEYENQNLKLQEESQIQINSESQSEPEQNFQQQLQMESQSESLSQSENQVLNQSQPQSKNEEKNDGVAFCFFLLLFIFCSGWYILSKLQKKG